MLPRPASAGLPAANLQWVLQLAIGQHKSGRQTLAPNIQPACSSTTSTEAISLHTDSQPESLTTTVLVIKTNLLRTLKELVTTLPPAFGYMKCSSGLPGLDFLRTKQEYALLLGFCAGETFVSELHPLPFPPADSDRYLKGSAEDFFHTLLKLRKSHTSPFSNPHIDTAFPERLLT